MDLSYLTGGGLRYAGYDKVWCIPKNALERYGDLEPVAISRTQAEGCRIQALRVAPLKKQIVA